MRTGLLACLALLVTLAATGCSTVSTSGKLLEARSLLEQARHRPLAQSADPAIVEAAAAIDFAEFEEQQRPGNPLASQRADRALGKARSALIASEGRR